jgi:tryptophanyl-tRNA synthetase
MSTEKSENQFGLHFFTGEERDQFTFIGPEYRRLIYAARGLTPTAFDGPAFIYTGRGPSKATFHIGHLPGLRLCLALQKHLNTHIEFMIADDEKMFRDGISSADMAANVEATLCQLHTLGFTDANTHFRINSSGISPDEYTKVIRMLSMVSVHTLNQIFGEKPNLGEYFYPLIQILPCLSEGRQCIVVAGVDQDPFFRLARDLAKRMGFLPPIVLYTHSVPGLDGSDKMSTSQPSSNPIFLNDSPVAIEAKVRQIRKVGAGSLDELFINGANLSADIPYTILSLFADEPLLSLVAHAYTLGLSNPAELYTLASEKGVASRNGRHMLTSYGIRKILTDVLTRIIHGVKR